MPAYSALDTRIGDPRYSVLDAGHLRRYTPAFKDLPGPFCALIS